MGINGIYHPGFAQPAGDSKAGSVRDGNGEGASFGQVLKASDGLFLSIFYDIAKNYPEIEANDKIVDNTCMQLVMNPQQFAYPKIRGPPILYPAT